MRKFISTTLLILVLGTIVLTQSSGTPSTLIVKTDANGYLLVTSATQTNPVTQGIFASRILKTDAGRALQVVLTGTVTPTYPQAIPASTCAAPSLGLSGGATTGIAFTSTPSILNCISGATISTLTSTGLELASASSLSWASRSKINSASDGVIKLSNNGETDFTRLQFGGTTSSFPALVRSGVSLIAMRADGGSNTSFGAATLAATDAQITNGSGTGITVAGNSGNLNDQIYKVTIDRTNFIAAATTADVTIGTIPAKTRILSVYADLTTVFACSATCTSTTLSFTLGTSAGATNIFLTFDADAALIQRGLADADLGANMTRATMIQGGYLPSWASPTILSLRLTSGTGNIGTGAATNLSTGVIVFYVHTARMP